VSLFTRIANLFRRSTLDREIESELASHIDMRIEDNLAAGMDPKQARRSARVAFGNPSFMHERTTEADTALYLESLWADIRYALRQLTRSPGFALTAMLTLALGVGANLAVFQLMHAVLFGHLPIPAPEELYQVHAAKTPFDGAWYLSYAAYRHLREAQPASAPVFAHSWIGQGVLQQPSGTSNRIDYQLVSDNFFDALGLHPALGRFFQTGEDQRLGSEWPVILRYGFFQQRFGADPAVVGKHFVVNGLPVVVVGVAPKGFSGLLQWNAPDVFFPLAAQSTLRLRTAFDSLGPGFGVNLDHAFVDQPTIFWLVVLTRAPLAAQPALSARWTSVLQSDIRLMASVTKDPHERAAVEASQVQFLSAANGEGSLHRRYATPLTILMAMSATILLVGCLNLANLQLARLTQREREFAIRIALGASRARILRQVAMEALILAAAGGFLAIVTGRASSALLLQWASGRGRPMPIDLGMHPQTSLVAGLLLFAAVVAFALLPAWHITGRNLPSVENSRSGSQTGQTKASRRWSSALLAAQVCFSLLLISAAALFAQTLRSITHTDTGMDRDQILSVHVDMGSTGFADRQKDLNAFDTLILDRLKSLPMVQDAAVSMCDIPMCGWNTFFHVSGHPELSDDRLHGEENHVGPGYFRTLGIPILEGRDFNQQDTLQTQRVAILNRAYARQLFGDQSPIGHWIGYNAPPGDHSFLVVGETADALLDGPRNPAPAVAYLSVTQDPAPIGTIEIRARGHIDALPADIRKTIHSVAPTLPITEIIPLAIELQDGLTTEQLLARLTTCFGALAMALAALGFYGLLSFRVARRTSEIGIRMALGATRSQVRSLFLRQTAFILLAGILPGAALSIELHSLLNRLIDLPKSGGAGASDLWPLTIAILVLPILVLACAGLLATLIPANRAASVNPVEALRSE
jgi:predicted permease